MLRVIFAAGMLVVGSENVEESSPELDGAAALQCESLAAGPTVAQAIDPKLDIWLDRLEAKSAEIKSLQVKLRFDKIQVLQGDQQRRFGVLYFQAGPPARFTAHFDKLIVDNRADKQDRWYIFDGRWLAVRYDDDKTFHKYETIAPGAEPQDADPLALGKGPFAVPVNFNKKRVLERFEVKLLDSDAEDDPPGEPTLHLQLTPKKGFDRDLKRVDLWYGRETLLPRRALTLSHNEEEKIIDLTEPKVNAAVDHALFDTRAPSEKGQRGYKEEIRQWERQ